jgi:GTP-binding protein
MVVSDIPGTTRDPVDLRMKRDGRDFLMVDTAGLRRRARVTERVEYYSRVRTEEALRRCDTAILLVDGVEGFTLQDTRIVEEAAGLGKGIVIGINKWDLVDKDDSTSGRKVKDLMDRFPSLSDYPVIFLSALTGQRTWRMIDMALEVHDRRQLRIPTRELNGFLAEINASTPPPSKRGRVNRMMYCVQPTTGPPTILFFTNRPKDVPENYRRFLERRLRERYDLLGTPVRVVFRQK